MKISGNTFIVTGGLGGLGQQCVHMLLEGGARVGIFDIVEQNTGEEKIKSLPNVTYVKVDISNKESAKEAVQIVVNKYGNLRGLVHCAGIALRREWTNKLSDSIDLFRKTIEINAVGTFVIGSVVADAINEVTEKELQLSAIPPSKFWKTEEERGIIVNFASIAGHEPTSRIVGYGPSKTCVLGLTKSFADFLGPSGIRVNSISPGIVATPMAGAHLGWFQNDLDANSIFPKRPAKPEHISMAVKQLIENEFINAEDIKVTGGWKLATTTFPGQGDPRDAAPGLE